MILFTSAFAGLQPSLGAFLGAHIAGAEHELYQVPGFQHRPLGPAFPFGVRAGLKLAGPLHLEGEAMIGPATGVGGGFLYNYGTHLALIIGDKKLRPLGVAGISNLGLKSKALGHDLDVAGYIGAGAEYSISRSVSVRLDLRWLLSARKGAARSPGSHAQLLIGVIWRKPGFFDQDGDGIVDAEDQCPAQPETVNQYLDKDGCPDSLASLIVTVRDAEGGVLVGVPVFDHQKKLGITDASGGLGLNNLLPGTELVLSADTELLDPAKQTLVLAEAANRVDLVLGWAPGTLIVTAHNEQGAAVPATVRAIGSDELSWILEEGKTLEEVVPPGEWRLLFASDGYDPVMKEFTIAPTSGARTEVDAVMKREAVQVEKEKIVILDPIHFEFDSHVVKTHSMGVVEAVAAALVGNPEILRIEVGGHASEEGTASYNLELSQARVDEVVRLLVRLGVDDERLTARGYGETQPLGENETEEGRARNRRVEFNILERAETP